MSFSPKHFYHRGHRGAARYTEKLLALLLHFSLSSRWW